jgi:hypothetical protein
MASLFGSRGCRESTATEHLSVDDPSAGAGLIRKGEELIKTSLWDLVAAVMSVSAARYVRAVIRAAPQAGFD